MLLRRTASLAALVDFEVAALLALHHLGSYEVTAVGWDDLGGWLAQTPPEDAIVAVVRLAALALAWWLTASTVLYALASVTRIPGLVRGVRWATCAPVRWTIDGALATTLVIGSTLATTGVAAAAPAVRTAVVVQLDEPDVGAEDEPMPVYQPRPAGDGVQVGYQPRPAGDRPIPPLLTVPHDSPPTTRPERPTDGPPSIPSPATYTVRRGDNLWTIAEQHLTKSTDSPRHGVSTEDVGAYWLQIVEANEDRLQSGDPDLIEPGETIKLP